MAINFQDNSSAIKNAINEGIKQGLLESGIKIKAAIQSRGDHPVDTGEMRQS